MPEQLSTEKQAVILDAARKRFAYYGFSKVTMDEIAADIGMGKASLYYYFPTKESLFEEVVKQEKNQFFNDIHSMMREKSLFMRHASPVRWQNEWSIFETSQICVLSDSNNMAK